uniref:BTB domain-containing protein n=1 Tax=viral metagenome TaxID=1070528 RepID=A0A6C0C856_9ZZZZ
MANDFCAQNMTLIKINGIEYSLYNHVLKTMSIFNVLFDCETNIMPEITWNISANNVNKVLHIIMRSDYNIDPEDNLLKHIEIIEFMRYIGVTNNILEEYIEFATGDMLIEYINKCQKIPYDDVMLFIFDNHSHWRLVKTPGFYKEQRDATLTDEFKILIDEIVSAHFPINFQKRVIKSTILKNIPDYKNKQSLEGVVRSLMRSYKCFSCGEYRKQITTFVAGDLISRDGRDVVTAVERVFDMAANCMTEILISHDKNNLSFA